VLVFGGPHTLSELAADEQVSLPTMSRVVAALEAEGLAERRPHQRDRRSAIINASTRGRLLMEGARQRRIEQLANRLAALGDDQLAALAGAAGTLEMLETIDDA
jgi:DNA-binding MarR family transcriptional regulator